MKGGNIKQIFKDMIVKVHLCIGTTDSPFGNDNKYAFDDEIIWDCMDSSWGLVIFR